MAESVADLVTAPALTPPAVAGRTFVVVLCGGGDRPIDGLGGRTPFEAAPTPAMDELAARGVSGLLDVIGGDIPPESDSGAMALLGYDPREYYTGRGPLEGLGMGFWDPDGYSVAFRVNFASWQPQTGRLDRRTSRDLSDDDLGVLVQQILDQVRLSGDVRLRLTGFGRHRGIMALTSRSTPLSGLVHNTDPGFVARGPFGVPVASVGDRPLPCRPQDGGGDAAQTTAELVNEFVEASAAVLQASEVNARRLAAGKLAANLVLVRDAGDTLPVLPPFGRQLSMYGQVPAERGVAQLIGARFTRTAAGRGHSDPEFYAQLLPTLLADPADVVFVHLKGPDEPGHDNRPQDKVRAIADIDATFLAPLMDALTPQDTLVITCDHATPCELGIHAPDPVPAVVVGPGLPVDTVCEFGERAMARGGLPVRRASALLPWLATVGAAVSS